MATSGKRRLPFLPGWARERRLGHSPARDGGSRSGKERDRADRSVTEGTTRLLQDATRPPVGPKASEETGEPGGFHSWW